MSGSSDPWIEFVARHKKRDQVRGEVVSATEQEAFFTIDKVLGRLTVSNMGSGGHGPILPDVGEKGRSFILEFDHQAKIVELSDFMPERWFAEWKGNEPRFAPGTHHIGEVTCLFSHLCFLHLFEGVGGVLTMAELRKKRDIQHPREMLAEGDKVEVVVLDIDQERLNLIVGLK